VHGVLGLPDPQSLATLAVSLQSGSAAAEGAAAPVLVLTIVLATAALVAVGASKLHVDPLPAYLIAGAIVGPHAMGPWLGVGEGGSLTLIEQAAIILLLFGVGLQLHLPVIKYDARRLLPAGLLAVALPIAIGWPIAALAFGVGWPVGLTVTMALALSSTAMVLGLLAANRQLHTPHGRLSLAILLIQDLAAIGMLTALPAIAIWQQGEAADAAASTGWGEQLADVALKIAVVAAVIAAGRWLLPRFLLRIASQRREDLLMVGSIAAALGAAAATSAVGFSPELGAFLAGFMLSFTPFRHSLGGQLRPLRDLFMAVFFVSLGMQLDPAVFATSWWIILLAVLTTLVIKAGCIGSAAWLAGYSGPVVIYVALALAQAGEFSLLVMGRAVTLGAASESIGSVVIAVIVTSLIVTPPMLWAASKWSPRGARFPRVRWARPDATRPDHGDDGVDRALILVGGFGPVGQQVTEALEQVGYEVRIVELNPKTVQEQSSKGRKMIFGSVADREVIIEAGVYDACALVLTIPDERATFEAISTARQIAPDLFIAARLNLASSVRRADEIGADALVVDELSAATTMSRKVQTGLERRRSDVAATDDQPPT